MQRLQKLPLPFKVVAYVVAATVVLAIAAGVGVMTALLLAPGKGPPEGAKSHQAGEANPGQVGQQGSAADRHSEADDRHSEAEYLEKVRGIQNEAAEASLQSNSKLRYYDALSADDIEDIRANYAALADYRDQVEDLDPPEGYERQHEIFVRATDELYAANKLAYRLAADPVSATEDAFYAYDRHIDRATSYLRQSNEILDRNYRTTEAAQDVILE